jgi:hypothetical protein
LFTSWGIVYLCHDSLNYSWIPTQVFILFIHCAMLRIFTYLCDKQHFVVLNCIHINYCIFQLQCYMCNTGKNLWWNCRSLSYVQHQVKYIQIFTACLLLWYFECICLIRQFSLQVHWCVYQKICCWSAHSVGWGICKGSDCTCFVTAKVSLYCK